MMTGIAGGWLIRGSQHTAVAVPAQTVNKAVPAAPAAAPAPTATDPAQLKQMADAQAAPLLRKLGAAPDSSELLTNLGNLYYDAQQYPTAVGYYQHALKGTPSDAAVRTDMATAYWYMGNADLAINEFNKALTYAPDSPNALFNRGLVKWKGKGDGAGAVADWKRLLAVRPNYEARDKVEQMLAEVQSHAGK
jgi:tetratricopeptide (TPR) repeat protein